MEQEDKITSNIQYFSRHLIPINKDENLITR